MFDFINRCSHIYIAGKALWDKFKPMVDVLQKPCSEITGLDDRQIKAEVGD